MAVFTSSPRNLQTRWKPKDTKALLFTFLDLIGQAENVLYQKYIFLTWQVCSFHACTAILYIILHNLFSFCSLILLGYVDTKQKNCDGEFAPSNCNKSLYAIMNVVQALNSNQSFIPYRPYKVTRILQDSLCKTSGAVLICCVVRILDICILDDFVLIGGA